LVRRYTRDEQCIAAPGTDYRATVGFCERDPGDILDTAKSLQINRVLGGVEVRYSIGTLFAEVLDERVRTPAACESVIALAANESVIARAANESVVVPAARENVVACASFEDVVAPAAAENVTADDLPPLTGSIC
jgi:hypothetical protein